MTAYSRSGRRFQAVKAGLSRKKSLKVKDKRRTSPCSLSPIWGMTRRRERSNFTLTLARKISVHRLPVWWPEDADSGQGFRTVTMAIEALRVVFLQAGVLIEENELHAGHGS
jgi:hypothetical protein